MQPHDLTSPLLRCLQDRGFIHQCTDLSELDELCSAQSITGYIGFDLTADSLHVGSLVQIMLLRWLQHFGHKPLVVLGGGTTKIGDPSGKDSSRAMLGFDTIESNKQAISTLLKGFLDTSSDKENTCILVDNASWLDSLSYVEVLRKVGPCMSINRMLSFDSVKTRLEREQNLSFLEFNYMILQAYDFVELAKRYGCCLQLGGSDQWGNIVSGIDLGRRLCKTPLYGLTAPLLTTASGAKMGKTANGAVWLSEQKLSAYDFWQFWRNIEDEDVGRFLKLFTTLPLDRIAELESASGRAINDVKIILANEVTALCHGEEKAETAQRASHQAFAKSQLDDSLPSVNCDSAHLGQEGILLTHLICQLGFSGSNSQARRLIDSGAVKLNDVLVSENNLKVVTATFSGANSIKLTVGKKKIGVLRK